MVSSNDAGGPAGGPGDDGSDTTPRIEILPEAQKEMEAIFADDPKAKSAFQEIFANLRQALLGVRSGQYASFDAAMFAITGQRPERVTEDDDE